VRARVRSDISLEGMMLVTMGTSREGAVLRLPLIVVETGTPTR
jgi:hypothetical protein